MKGTRPLDPQIALAVAELLQRSNRLGADPANTNHGGGNTSAKALGTDPVTGSDVELLWVKGSGGDLGTLTANGLAVLRLDRVSSLARAHAGADRDDEMFALLEYCRHGDGGAPPSIDTAMHALTAAQHVDHLHPDAGIALATAAEGEKLTRECFGRRVAWVPWRRPGFQLGLDVAAIQRELPDSTGVILGGHGITAWGETSQDCEQRSMEIIATARRFLEQRGRADPFGPEITGYAPLPDTERRTRAAALGPMLRGLASADRRQVGHFSDHPAVLYFLSRTRHPKLAALGTSCPDHFLRTKVRPLLLDLPPGTPLEKAASRLAELFAAYRQDYRAYYQRHAGPATPAMRGDAPAVVLVPGVGMFSFGPTAREARLAGEFYRNAINAMRGAEAVSEYSPISEAEKFKIEYWDLEEAKLARQPSPQPLTGRVALITGGGSGIGAATAARLAAEGACVVVADKDKNAADDVAGKIAGDHASAGHPGDAAIATEADVASEASVAAAFTAVSLAYGGVDLVVSSAGLSISKPLVETTAADWDLQHQVMARGSFLVAREAARVMKRQGLGGDIISICSKNAVAAGPDNVGYGAAKADQAHQVRLLAAELGADGIRVNGVNPDAVVRGSKIFAGSWGRHRAALYGVPVAELGAFYASRTLLKREVLPEHVAAAVFALTGGDLSLTTGLLIPVDGGVPAAFLR